MGAVKWSSRILIGHDRLFRLLRLDLDQRAFLRRRTKDAASLQSLWRPPEVDEGRLVDAGDGAVGCAGFLSKEFAADVGGGVFGQRDARVAALLRAVMDQAVLADVEIA